MDLTVIGTGYVGLVTGTCFAEMGNHVTCVDIDDDKIRRLKGGDVPIYEPGLEEILDRNIEQDRLQFSTELGEGRDAAVFFIAVGTPSDTNGAADLSAVVAVAEQIGEVIDDDAIVVNKSTVPVGTADKVHEVIDDTLQKRGVDIDVDVVSNPEFLKEGDAVNDFMKPDRIIVGTESDRAQSVMKELYAPFNRNHERTLYMGVRDAEMTKYTANAMLATKISFMNEIANISENLGVDVENVRLGIGSDERIGYHFIYPGCGFGGSCFPKDVRALTHMARDAGIEPRVLGSVVRRNEEQQQRLPDKIIQYFGADLADKTVAVWGLSFKPGTDDMRRAPSIPLIEQLIDCGATIRAYDPVSMGTAREVFDDRYFERNRLILADHQYQALEGADALALVTEWKPFRHPDFAAMKRLMDGHAIFDGRNQYEPRQMAAEGFDSHGIGRGDYLTQ